MIEMVNDEPMNEKEFDYTGSNLTKFHADRSDFRGGIKVYHSHFNKDRENAFLNDLMEMVWYHTYEILPRLNGFGGYRNIRLEHYVEESLGEEARILRLNPDDLKLAPKS